MGHGLSYDTVTGEMHMVSATAHWGGFFSPYFFYIHLISTINQIKILHFLIYAKNSDGLKLKITVTGLNMLLLLILWFAKGWIFSFIRQFILFIHSRYFQVLIFFELILKFIQTKKRFYNRVLFFNSFSNTLTYKNKIKNDWSWVILRRTIFLFFFRTFDLLTSE